MPRMVITSKVTDMEHCLQGKARRAALFGQFGSDITDYVAMDGSNEVAVTADIEDMDRVAQALVASPPPQVAAELESQGVILPIVAYIEK